MRWARRIALVRCAATLMVSLIAAAGCAEPAGHPMQLVKQYGLGNDRNDAAKVSEDAMRRYERSAAALNNGVRYSEDGKYTEALEYFQKALEIDPKMGGAYADRAAVYLKLKQPAKALTDIDKAIKLEPGNYRLHVTRVRALTDLHRFKEALLDAGSLINDYPDAFYFTLRADVWKRSGNRQAAIKDLEAAVLASEQSGEDAMDEVEQLERLTGHKVQRPKPNDAGARKIVQGLRILVSSAQRFDPTFIGQHLGNPLEEAKILNAPEDHSLDFRSREDKSNVLAVHLDLDRRRGPFAYISVDTHRVHVGVREVEQMFGKPDNSDDDEPPGEIIYSRPWGVVKFQFHEHGFRSLYGVTLTTKKLE